MNNVSPNKKWKAACFILSLLWVCVFNSQIAHAVPPTVTISIPADGSAHDGGDSIPFVGSATDAQGTSLTGTALVWVSNKNGEIGTGGSITINTLQTGPHTITLIATDALDQTGSDSISITVSNNPPTSTITAPANNSNFQAGDPVNFSGSGTDIDSNDTLTYSWESSLDDNIGTGQALSRNDLSVGTHVIVLWVSDGTVTVESLPVSIEIINNPPVATILSPEDGDNYYPGTAINFNGSGTDTEDDPTDLTYAWECSEHGSLSFDKSFTSSSLATGDHTISLTVTDTHGVSNTTQQSVTIFIGNYDPVATISQPSTGTSYDKDDVIIFQGSATDNEDGSLAGASLVWSSDIEEDIGTGSTLSLNDLQSGTHIITLTASDTYSPPGTGTDSIIITINNTFPTVTITNPADGNSYYEGSSITFSGTGNDPEDGELTNGSLVWSSSITGTIGQGSPLSLSSLVEGTHSITLTATDSEGASVTSDPISITIGNNAPVTTITVPSDGQSYLQGTDITFKGTGEDIEDGTLTGAALSWESSLDSTLGSGTVLTTDDLSIGSHTITLTASDTQGATSSVAIALVVTNNLPVATIVNPGNNSVYNVGSTVTFNGLGEDEEDGQLSTDSLVWVSSIDGQIGTGNSFSTTTLSEGSHLITFSVTDSDGDTDQESIIVNIGNNPPEITISLPVEDDTYLEGQFINFQANVIDAEDGALQGDSVVWISDLDGQFATSPSPASINTFSVGQHTITVVATDSNGASTRSTPITIRVGNQSPVPRILSPEDGKSYEFGDEIVFEGTATDEEDGVLLDASIVWSSSREGQIGTGTSFTLTNLASGEHAITLTATDSDGAISSSTITITAQNARPVAEITDPESGSSYDEGRTIIFRGTGTDAEDGALTETSLSWRSNWDGILGTGTIIETDTLSSGTHTITLTVTDNNGSFATDTITVTILPMTVTPLTLSIKKGSTGMVTISGGKSPYRVASRRKYIASPIEDNGAVTITGITEGTTTITITDNTRKASVVNVSVTAQGSVSDGTFPVANAGNDKSGVIEGDLVTLNGQATSGSDSAVSFLWTQTDPADTDTPLANPTVMLSNSTSASSSFIVPLADISGSTLAFRLTVTNNTGSDTDVVMVTIQDNGVIGFPNDAISFLSGTGKGIAMKSGPNCTFDNIYADEASNYPKNKRPEDLKYGIIQSNITTQSAGSLIYYTLHLPYAAPSEYHWFKYIESNDRWINFDRELISENTGEGAVFSTDRKTITVYLKDESAYDANNNDMAIADVGSLGASLPEKDDDESFGSCFINTVFFQ